MSPGRLSLADTTEPPDHYRRGIHVGEEAVVPATFRELGVPTELAAELATRGIAEPFPIQVAAIPDALAGKDICARAPTGSGKTIAFGIPLVMGIAAARSNHPTGLVLVPTRELAAQVNAEIRHLGRPVGRSTTAIFGGVSLSPQISALDRGVDVLVATPGRLLDLIDQRCVELDEVQIAVVDEADRMADMGFLPDVRSILDRITGPRQTLLFSATLDDDVDDLIQRYQRQPVHHDATPLNHAVAIEHLFWKVTPHTDRVRQTAEIIDRLGSVIVFTRTRHGADRVSRQLGSWNVKSVALHGDKSQAARTKALADFTAGKVRALVATDVAARGIHVDAVDAVVQFDPPADIKDYQHRAGRTGRAGATGMVITLVTTPVVDHTRNLIHDLGLSVDIEPAGVWPTSTRGSREASRAPHTDSGEMHVSTERAVPGGLGGAATHPGSTRAP